MVRRICCLSALLALVWWCGLSWSQEPWVADVCFKTNFLLDRFDISVQPLWGPLNEVPEGTMFKVDGVWYVPGLYTILLSGTAVFSFTDTDNFWSATSLTGANGSEWFQGDQNFSLITHGNQWRIQASGTTTPFQVEGTFTSINVERECNPEPSGRVPAAALPVPFRTTAPTASASASALGYSPSDVAGHPNNNALEK